MNSDPQILFRQAVAFHQQGHLAEAETIYLQLIAAQPMSGGPRYRLGVLRLQQGRHAEALDLIGGALKIHADDAEAWANYATAQGAVGQITEAVASLDKALAISPDFAGAIFNRALMLQQLRRFDEALAGYDKVLERQPDFVGALFNRGILLQDHLRRPADALAAFDTVLAANPGFAEAWSNRGHALRDLERLDEALASYDRALSLKPDFVDAISARGKILLESGRMEDGFAAFRQRAALVFGSSPRLPDEAGPPYKMRHDREQKDYLAGIAGKSSDRAGARVQGPAVRPDNHVAETSQLWRTKEPQIAVIDNLLTDEALAALRRFCWEEPVWRAPYANGYLGAFPEHGFVCPLLGQIADELARTFPAIFHAHPLLYLWGFKYDSQLSGINIHADQAAVNVNFWLTPDEANLDAGKGGLVIWDVAAPLDWNFDTFNGDGAAIRDFLEREGAKPVTVPYRANRAVIFDSDLFHETDTIRFKPGYLNRRINVTMLYGRRDRGDI